MLHTLSKRIAFFLFKDGQYPIEVYVYGLELIISSLVGEMVVLFLGLMLDRLMETLIFILLIKYIRIYSGGFHAKTYIVCNMTFITSYLFSVLICYKLRSVQDNTIIGLMIITVIIAIATMIKLAPIENKNKPISVERRPILRRKAVAVVTFVGFAFVMVYYLYRVREFIMIIPGYLTIVISMLVELRLYGKDGNYEEDGKIYIGKSGCKDR